MKRFSLEILCTLLIVGVATGCTAKKQETGLIKLNRELVRQYCPRMNENNAAQIQLGNKCIRYTIDGTLEVITVVHPDESVVETYTFDGNTISYIEEVVNIEPNLKSDIIFIPIETRLELTLVPEDEGYNGIRGQFESYKFVVTAKDIMI